MEKVIYDYDEESDVLYISLGQPKEALSTEKNYGILVRTSPGSNEVFGVTVVDFTKVLGCYPQFIEYVKSLDLPPQLTTGIEEISLSYKTRQ